MTWQMPTYPHHEFCVAPDHRCLAELERETKGTVEKTDDTRLSLSLHNIPLSPRRWVRGRGRQQKATATTLYPSQEPFAIKPDPLNCS